jgi:starch phosphorylase
VTGWAIEGFGDATGLTEAESLYTKLVKAVMPAFYGQPEHYAEVMRSSIAINGSFFNTQRMVTQYLTNAYAPKTHLMASWR